MSKIKDFIYEHIYIPLRILCKDKTGLAGLIIVSAYIVMAIVGPLLVPLDLTPRLEEKYLPPSLKHPLGTDFAGRDIFAQIVHGGPPVLRVAFLAALVTVAIGTIVGLIAGYAGGILDLIITSVIDIFLTIPGFPLLMIIAVWLMQSGMDVTELHVALLLSITAWPGLARAIRSQVLSIKKEPYIEVAKCLGLSRFYIIFKEILPNMMPYIAINFMLNSVGAIYAYTGLLALGLLPYTPGNWGAMIHMAQAYTGTIGTGWWYVLAPSMAIIILQIGLVFLSNGVDKIFNPRLREE